MHWENFGALAPFTPFLAGLLLAWLAAWLLSRRRRLHTARDSQRSAQAYRALELAHQAKLRAIGWVRGSRVRKLTWQPAPAETAIAGRSVDAYGDPMDERSFSTRLARARFRAWHRGTREADYTIGGFYDRHHAAWGEAELGWFESLLEEEDSDILGWAMAAHAPPEKYRGPLMSALQKLDYVAI